MSLRTTCILGTLFLFLASTSPVVAQWVPVSEKKGFGQSLDATDGTVFVGDPDNTYRPGRVSVYERGSNGGWQHRTFLKAKDAQLDDRFGSSLDAEGGTLAVGAPAAGSVYVFRRRGSDGGWTQVGHVAPADSTLGFGRSVEVSGGRLFVSASKPTPGNAGDKKKKEKAGVVYVFKPQNESDWRKVATLQHAELSVGGDFGATLLGRKDQLVVGAPEHEEGALAVYSFQDGEWVPTQTLTAENAAEGSRFGASLHWTLDQLVVGAPQADNGRGAVYLVSNTGGQWGTEQRLRAFDGTSNDAFGASLAYSDRALWVGAPGADREAGALYRFNKKNGNWSAATRISPPEPEQRDRFGATMAAPGSTVAVGLPGDNFGAGTMALYSASGSWTDGSPVSPPEGKAFSAMTGKKVTCSDGDIKGFSCKNVDLHAFLPKSAIGAKGGIELNDVWGWTDPQTGTEYALVGRADGTSFVDVSNPSNPVYVGELPKTAGSRANTWRDIKVHEDHAFVVADNVGDHGMQVFDLTQLRTADPSQMPVTFEPTAHYDQINSAHNIAINGKTGYAYIVGGSGGGKTCGGGLHMVNIQDPLNPTFAGCFGGERGAGSGGTGSTHDAQCTVYEGPDQEYRGREICVAFNETEIAVVDVTDKEAPTLISTATYPNFGYVHQGWFTGDQRYMYSNDEVDELAGKVGQTRTIVWDMKDLDNPVVANQLSLSNRSSDHNLYVKGDKIYESNYKSGLRVLDISNPEKPEEVGHFDLFPPSDTPGFEGAWSNYPYFESGIVVTATFGGGFFVLEYSQPEL